MSDLTGPGIEPHTSRTDSDVSNLNIFQIEETDKEREVRLKKWEKFLSGGDEEGSGEEVTSATSDEKAEAAAPDSKDWPE